MRNHWHFVIWPQRDRELTAFVRWLAHRHAMRWHVAHKTVGRGHLMVGRNQVCIQSTLMGAATTRPRICLKCSLRPEYGMPREVYYEYIRDVCCADPLKCEAPRRFNETRETA